MKDTPQRIYTPHRLKNALDCTKGGPETTNQAFKDECDINRVLDRSKHGASLSHLLNHGGSYGDFSTWNENTFEQMQIDYARGVSIFNDLPAELRSEFDHNPGKFFGFVNDPENTDRLEEIFPALAAPGRQFPDVVGEATATKILETLASLSSDGPPKGASDNPDPDPDPATS